MSIMDTSQAMETINMEDIVVAGQVKEIELENFMCHANLKMKFKTDKYNCFYIVGPNGSGKSAIFAGLNIGLGGKGRANNRGNSLSSYIKEGEASAKIKVHLSNVGANRNPHYDDEIIVERIIRATSTTYSLKSLDGSGRIRVVSTAKKDLDNILKRFSIELENPLCWLSQDRAREFLQEMKPNKLYEIFMITSELCLVNRYNATTAEQLQDMGKILESWKEKQREMKENYKKLEQIAAATQKINIFKREMSKYQWIDLWIPMKINHEKAVKIDEHITTFNRIIEETDIQIDGRGAESDELNESFGKIQDSCKQLHNQIGTNKAEALQAKGFQIDDNILQKNNAAKISQYRSRIKNHDAEIQSQNELLESLLGRYDRDIIGEKAELQHKIDDDREKLQHLRDDREGINQTKITVEAQRNSLIENIDEYRKQIRNCEYKITSIQRDQRERQRAVHDQMSKFGPNTTNILKCLNDHASKFSKKPIGPVGMLLKLKDKKWAAPIEFALKNQLTSYICDNANDRRIFEEMLKRFKLGTVPISTVKFSDHKYNVNEPDQNILTVARALKVDNPTVFNFLVDNASIESIMLFERDEEGREVMSQNPPANISKAYTLSNAQIFPVSRDRPYRFYVNPPAPARVLVDGANIPENDFENQIKIYQEDIDEAKRRIEEFRHEEQESKAQCAAVLKEIKANESESIKLERNITGYEEEMRKLDSIASRETLINGARLSLEEINRQKAKDEAILNQALQEKETLAASYEEKGQRVQEYVDRGKQLLEELVVAERRSDELRGLLDNFNSNTEKLHNKKRVSERQLVKNNEQKAKLEAEKVTLEEHIAENAPKYEKPDNLTDPPEFDQLIDGAECSKRIGKFKTEIARLIRLNEDQHVTEEELEAAKNEYEKASEAEKEYSKRMKKVSKAFDDREELFEKVKQEIPGKLRQTFRELMSMRRYNGDLTVDHEAQTINIQVQTHSKKDATATQENDDQEEEDNLVSDEDETGTRRLSRAQYSKKVSKKMVQDLRGLSGGERSYTTACFVMALWSCVESPFRCLDEFDVFMDMVNRRIIMELLSDLARKYRHIQFFFFTPQGISELHANDVEVFTMAPARARK